MLDVLERAISDIGYWRWWTAGLPGVFQVEFGGVQLWNEPASANQAPSSVVALRFRQPSYVAFLTDEGSDLPGDWPAALQEDRLEAFGVAYEHFTLTSIDKAREITRSMRTTLILTGDPSALTATPSAFLAFKGDEAGLVIAAESMTVLNHRGALTPEQVIDANQRWWTYWREYWDRMNTEAPMPYDTNCEIVIPLGTQDKDD